MFYVRFQMRCFCSAIVNPALFQIIREYTPNEELEPYHGSILSLLRPLLLPAFRCLRSPLLLPARPLQQPRRCLSPILAR